MNLLTQPVGLTHYLVVAAVLFVAGVVCMATKRNAVAVLMGIELVLNAANINFIAFSSPKLCPAGRAVLGLDGQWMALFVIVLATFLMPLVRAVTVKLIEVRGWMRAPTGL